MEKQNASAQKTGFLKALSRKAKKTSKSLNPRTQFWRPGDEEDIPRHIGKGPKGYTRKDDRIFEDVCEYLTQDPSVDATDLTVEVESGIVTLRGTVENVRMKQAAHDCAQSASGVLGINNEISVKLKSPEPDHEHNRA